MKRTISSLLSCVLSPSVDKIDTEGRAIMTLEHIAYNVLPQRAMEKAAREAAQPTSTLEHITYNGELGRVGRQLAMEKAAEAARAVLPPTPPAHGPAVDGGTIPAVVGEVLSQGYQPRRLQLRGRRAPARCSARPCASGQSCGAICHMRPPAACETRRRGGMGVGAVAIRGFITLRGGDRPRTGAGVSRCMWNVACTVYVFTWSRRTYTRGCHCNDYICGLARAAPRPGCVERHAPRDQPNESRGSPCGTSDRVLERSKYIYTPSRGSARVASEADATRQPTLGRPEPNRMRAQSINIWQYSRPKGAHPLLATSSTCGMARPHRPHTPGMRMVTAAAVAGHARPPRAAPYATASQPTATPNETAGGVAATLCCREAASHASVAPLEEVRLLGPRHVGTHPRKQRSGGDQSMVHRRACGK